MSGKNKKFTWFLENCERAREKEGDSQGLGQNMVKNAVMRPTLIRFSGNLAELFEKSKISQGSTDLQAVGKEGLQK